MEPPIPPDEADCCNSGCNPCIFDVYEEQLRKYNAQLIQTKSNFQNCIMETSYSIFKLIDKIQHTKDTYFLIFEYCRPFRNDIKEDKSDLTLHFKPGQHFLLRRHFNVSYNHFTRAYTPIPFVNIKPLCFCILVKIYEDGMMSKYLKNLRVSAETLWRGPYCDFRINYNYKNTLMIAQGTGISPLYAIINEMLNNDNCETFITLYFCCHSCDDILLREELYQCLQYWNFKYEIFLSATANTTVKYNEIIHKEKLTKSNIEGFLKNNNSSTQVLICGSEDFNRNMSENVDHFGKIDVFIF